MRREQYNFAEQPGCLSRRQQYNRIEPIVDKTSLVTDLGSTIKGAYGYSASDFQRKICGNEEKGLMVNTESYCSSMHHCPLRRSELSSVSHLSIQGPPHRRRNALLPLTRAVGAGMSFLHIFLVL
ncbi:hypothetical protein C8J56DRAFT_1030173 [Mycena floridula]|nr:hypothetical protein C8J56DRAFT_1030173 [Mycena floridula]